MSVHRLRNVIIFSQTYKYLPFYFYVFVLVVFFLHQKINYSQAWETINLGVSVVNALTSSHCIVV